MNCRYCQFENPSGMKFCGNCGARLELVCPQCSSAYPPEFKFCGQCGHHLTSLPDSTEQRALSFDEKLEKIQRYLPDGLTEKILSQKERIEGERRRVTVMFVDMKGFTPIAESLGSEETFALMDQVFEILINCIHEYGGTVNELRGDGVLALFGSPIALEEAPQRAIRSSLAIHREMIRFSEKLGEGKGIPPILVRVGINTGSVVVGTVGNDLRVQFTAVGDTINMAARMEQLAEPGTTYVTQETFRATEGFFRFEALGERLVKGKKKPLEVYRVIAPSTRRTRFDVSSERGLTRLVGRQRELELLLEGFEQAKGGHGQAFSIMGEAGVGKSRLLYEFRKAVANEDIWFLEGKCLSYGRENAYHPIVDMLKSNFGVEDGDTEGEVTDKVKRGLSVLGIDEASTLPYLLDLLSVKDSGIDSMSMSPAARKDRILRSVQRLVLKGSERRPLVLAFEDLHWTDKSSEESAKSLLESIPRARILMIFTYRPEFVHTWGGKSFHNQITLNRLSNQESLSMVSHILGSDEVAMDLSDLILEKTEGVPFFIEEFVRALRDMAIIERNESYHLAQGVNRVAIPATVQDTIMARVDSLPHASKEVLLAGSAIDREFSFKLMKAVTELPEPALVSYLSELMYAELVYERGIFPESTYIFRHAITREVVYDSILTGRKKLLHQKVGQAIEDLSRDNLDSYYGILADHFMLGEDFERSAKYSRRASEKSWSQGAVTSAISYGQKRIAAMERLDPAPEIQAKLVDARIGQGLLLFAAGHLAEAKEAVEPIAEVTLQGSDKIRLTRIYFILGAYEYSVEENVARGLELLKKAVQNAKGITDVRSASLAYFYYGEALCLNCQFDRGAESIEKAIKILEAVQNLWAVSTLYSHLSYYAYNYQGKVEEGFATSIKAMEIAESSGDIHSRAHAFAYHGISCFYKGLLTAAEQYLLKAINMYEQHPVPAIGHQFLGYIHFEKGDYEKSQAHYQQAIKYRQEAGVLTSCVNLNKVALARAYVAEGKTDVDIQSLVQLVRDTKSKLYYGTMSRHLAEIFLHLGEDHFSEAESWLQAAIVSHEERGMRWDWAGDCKVFAQFWRLRGRSEEEKDYLTKALLQFSQCGAEGWSRRMEAGRIQG